VVEDMKMYKVTYYELDYNAFKNGSGNYHTKMTRFFPTENMAKYFVEENGGKIEEIETRD
jgi:hypothetical protein